MRLPGPRPDTRHAEPQTFATTLRGLEALAAWLTAHGVTRVASNGQGHHLRHWAHGGPTTLTNLALLCRRHHRAVHEEGYQVERGPDGALRFRRPDGRALPEMPPPAAGPGDPIKALRACHDSQGLRLDARTARAGWLGERLDLVWAIDVLHPLAQRSSIPTRPSRASRARRR